MKRAQEIGKTLNVSRITITPKKDVGKNAIPRKCGEISKRRKQDAECWSKLRGTLPGWGAQEFLAWKPGPEPMIRGK